MKQLLVLTLMFIALSMGVSAQEYIDVVYLKNGSRIKGIVIEQVPNESLKIQTADGSVFVYRMSEIEKIAKEGKTGNQASFGSSAGSGATAYPMRASFSFKGGLLMGGPGEMEKENYGELDTETSPMIKMDVDGLITPRVSFGLSAMFTPMEIDGFDDPTNYFSIIATIRPRFIFDDNSQLRPAFGFGYATFNNSYMEDYGEDPSDGLNLNLQLEYFRPIGNGLGIVGEFGLISQPVGGNDDFEYTFSPLFYLLVGIELFK